MKTVLLAYEREQDLNAMEALLKARGHTVLRAKNGVDALEQVRREGPSVVVSDVLLPKLDGFALCRRIRRISKAPAGRSRSTTTVAAGTGVTGGGLTGTR